MKIIAPSGLIHFHDSLYSAPGTVARQSIVFTKRFTHPRGMIALRPFCAETDLSGFYSRKKNASKLSELIATSYRFASESSFALSYMVLLNGTKPVCSVDICNALLDEICEHFDAREGDYIIRLTPILAAGKKQKLYSRIVVTCLSWFALFPEVGRILIECETENEWQQELLHQAGFARLLHVCSEFRETELYCCSISHHNVTPPDQSKQQNDRSRTLHN